MYLAKKLTCLHSVLNKNKFSSHNLPNYAVEDIGWRVQSTMFKAWLHFKRTHKEPRDKATLNI